MADFTSLDKKLLSNMQVWSVSDKCFRRIKLGIKQNLEHQNLILKNKLITSIMCNSPILTVRIAKKRII